MENNITSVKAAEVNSESLLLDALKYFPVVDQHLRSIRALALTLAKTHAEESEAMRDYRSMITQCTNLLLYLQVPVDASVNYLASASLAEKITAERENAALH